ncbi:MAG: VWA domain-containing protein [Treponema sp.]|nr:VWA domain-containing protein [Treponema sp.]
MLEFRNPFVCALVILVPLFAVLRTLGIFKHNAVPVTLSDWGGDSFVWKRKIYTVPSFCAKALVTVGFVAAIGALAEPVIVRHEPVYTSRGADILFVLDTSPSMAARDMDGLTRFDAARQTIAGLTQKNGGTSFGIVAFAADAAVIVPLTTDAAFFSQALDSLAVGMLGDGSALGTGISTAVYHLVGSTAPVKCIVLITDGENNAGSIHPYTAAEIAARNGIILYTLAIGSQGTVPLDYVDAVTGKKYSGYLESSFDSSALRQIAEKAGGRAFDVQTVDALTSAFAVIAGSTTVAQTYYTRTVSESYQHIFLGCAVLACAAGWCIRRLYLKEVC